jgi:hypothetical protein
MLPIAGNVMPWWWDSYLKSYELNRFFSPLCHFSEGMDRRSGNYRRIETAILQEEGPELSVRGLLNNRSCYLWFYRGSQGSRPDDSPPLVTEGQKIALSGMLGGRYGVTILDTVSGQVLRRTLLSSTGGNLTIPLARSENSIAVRVLFRGDPDPRFHTSPELMRVEMEEKNQTEE